VTATGRSRPRRSLRRTSRWVIGGLGLVLVLCVVGGTRSVLALADQRTELSDRLHPAATAAASLRASSYSQQNAVRGYALSEDPSFLEPWESGRGQAAGLIRDLRVYLVDHRDALALVDEVEGALTRWQEQHAVALIAAASDLDPGEDMRPLVFGSRDAFDQVREANEALTAEIEARRADARLTLDAAADRLVRTLALASAALAASLVVAWVALRRVVLRPLAQLVDDASRIADGDLDHVPAQDGPAEVVELGRSIDHVRIALVEQLREVEAREADLARSNAELEQFAYVASHDLQEPLRKVASFCQMLERRYKGQLDERADQYIAFAVDGAKRMQDLINDLLAFSRVGRTTERFAPVELEEVFDRACRNLASSIDDAGATIRHDPLPAIEGDRNLLVALFQNLVGNAVKFRGADPPEVVIAVRSDGDHVEIAVSDNGIGIPEEYRDRIFVIFQRLHGREEYAGTGIGLALCRKIVEFHGGRIEVDPDHPGPGTTIRFTLQVTHTTAPSAPAIDTEELVTP
jgi:signal transduction histidine kinase